MRSKAILVTATVLSASMLSGAAFARNANTTQNGTLLVFPKVDIYDGAQTVIRISNNGNRNLSLKCYWQNGYKANVDFIIAVTKNQPIWFDATTGFGTVNVPPFPTTYGVYTPDDPNANYKGELKCWVVNGDDNIPVQYNYMSGDATTYNAQEGTAYRYNAWRFRADANNDAWVYVPRNPVTTPQADGSWRLPLDGSTLSSCPQYVMGQFNPSGVAADSVQVGSTELSVATCRQDFRQDRDLTFTKLQFDIWNEQETKFTGAYECINSWWTGELESVDNAGSQFSWNTLKTPTARYRVRGIASNQCWPLPTANAGLVAVQSSSLTLFGDPNSAAKVAEELTAAGTSTADDYIWYDSDDVSPSFR